VIEAGHKISIKAAESIDITVGRSTISISDSGITICSKRGANGFATNADTSLLVKANGGVTVFGTNFSVATERGFSLSETYGSSISGKSGLVGINGKKVTTGTISGLDYIAKAACAAAGTTLNATSLGLALSGDATDKSNINKANSVFMNVCGFFAGTPGKFYTTDDPGRSSGFKNLKPDTPEAPVGSQSVPADAGNAATSAEAAKASTKTIWNALSTVFDLIASLADTTISVFEMHADEYGKTPEERNNFRSRLYLSSYVIQLSTIIESVLSVMFSGGISAIFSTASIELTPAGEIEESGKSAMRVSTGETKLKTPVAGFKDMLSACKTYAIISSDIALKAAKIQDTFRKKSDEEDQLLAKL
ncbi:MAG: hypothetical protein LBV52_00780, partial [Spirochaetaceae bacterium]|nr:hypothetical protein [Spirochaetaceae bacterium]